MNVASAGGVSNTPGVPTETHTFYPVMKKGDECMTLQTESYL